MAVGWLALEGLFKEKAKNKQGTRNDLTSSKFLEEVRTHKDLENEKISSSKTFSSNEKISSDQKTFTEDTKEVLNEKISSSKTFTEDTAEKLGKTQRRAFINY